MSSKESETELSNVNRITSEYDLISFMVNTIYPRICNGTLNNIDQFESTFITIINNERHSNPNRDEHYDNLVRIVLKFMEYLRNSTIAQDITEKELTKTDFLERVKTEALDIPKRQYDMSSMYNPDLLARESKDSEFRKVRIFLTNRGIYHDFYDEEGYPTRIIDLGQVGYKGWGGGSFYLSIYQIDKLRKSGEITSDIVCSSISIPEMSNPEYRKAVLEELLSDENIRSSNAGSYIGTIEKSKKSGDDDTIHTERQNSNGYTYRVSDNYVLAYDPAEATAVMQAIAQFSQKSKSSKKVIDMKTLISESTKAVKSNDESDEHSGR